MDDLSPVITPDGRTINIEELDKTYDQWVHTGREIAITKCAPESAVAVQYLRNPDVYRLTRHIRGRALLISNTGYQALKLLKNLFEQLQFRIGIYTERNSQEVRSIIEREAQKSDNEFADSFIVIIYGPPDDFDLTFLPEILNDKNAPLLKGKPKLLHVIGNDTIVQQVVQVAEHNKDPDYLLGSTGFNGVMFYIYALCMFVHELSARNMWKILCQFADRHRFTATSHCTLTKEFFFFPGLTVSFMPEEIRNMDPGDIELYLQMLETSRMSNYNVRLMFVGLYGAGKTSLARRIMGRDISDVTSTDGIDVYIGKCRVNLNDQSWVTLEDTQTNTPYTKLARLLIIDEKSESRIPNIKTLEYPAEESEIDTHLEDENTADPDLKADIDDRHSGAEGYVNVEVSSKRFRSDSDANVQLSPSQEPMEFENIVSPTAMSTTSDDSTDFEIVNILYNRSMTTAKRVIEDSYKKGPRPKEAHVSLWDFAGQFVYYATHQLFFSPRSIYILALNMEEDLDKTLAEDWFLDLHGVEEIETQGGVMFWLRSIYTYSHVAQPGVPPIILVGTHKDQLQGDDQAREAQGRKYFRKIKSMFQGSPIEYHICKESFLVDNTRQDPNIERLKDYVMQIAKSMPYWGEQVPAKWVELEQALEDVRLDGKAFITRRELKEIDKALAKPIGDEDQLTLFLTTHHEQGSLIYFQTVHLENTVVLDPQWIIHAFRYLISAKHFGSKYGELHQKWLNFIDSGHLEVELAKAIWEKDNQHDFYANHETILHYLEKLDIIVKGSIVSDQDGKKEQLPFYFVPCLVKESPNPNILKMPKNIQHARSTPVLCIAFEERFLPPAVFNRVVAGFLSRWPIARQGNKNLLFCGCAVFEVKHEKKGQDRHRMTIFCRQGKIGVRITRYTTSKDKTVDNQICNIVRRVLVSAIRQEFSRYRKVSKDDTMFSYKLQCMDTEELDQLHEGLLNVDDLVEAVETDYFCEAHSDMAHPHLISAVEMLRDWFPEKIPADARIQAASFEDIWLQRLSDDLKNRTVDDKFLSRITRGIGMNWQFICIELGVKQTDIDKIEESWPHMADLQTHKALCLWKNTEFREGRVPVVGQLLNAFRARSSDVTLDWETIQNVTEGIE